jgi:hypothetical protein
VHQLTRNPFLSRYRLQQVKKEGKSTKKSQQLKDVTSVWTLCCSHDVAVLFEEAKLRSGCATIALSEGEVIMLQLSNGVLEQQPLLR